MVNTLLGVFYLAFSFPGTSIISNSESLSAFNFTNFSSDIASPSPFFAMFPLTFIVPSDIRIELCQKYYVLFRHLY